MSPTPKSSSVPIDPPLDELGFYTLAGAPESPRDLLDEVRDGRGARARHARSSPSASTSRRRRRCRARPARCRRRIRIATAATNHNTRHPMVTAAYATTMHRLTGGRFALGLGRGIDPLFDALGLPPITTAQIEDFVGLMRRLWRGEVVFGHDGPAGKYPLLHLDPSFDEDIPLGLDRVRPELARARRAGVRRGRAAHVLHRRDARALRRARSARPPSRPAATRLGAGVVVLATVGDHLPEDAAAEEDRRPAGDLPPGLRRPAGPDERLGSRRAERFRADPSSPATAGPSTEGATPRSSSTSPSCCPTSGSSPRPPAPPSSASPACAASSTSASTASSCTAPPPPSSNPSSTPTGS